MPPKKKARQSSTHWFVRLLFPAALILILAGITIYYQDAFTWIRPGETAEETPAAELSSADRLEEAIILGAREMGVARHRIARRPGDEGVPRYEFRCPDRLHPMAANRWLSRVFEDAGLEILDCVEEGSPARPKLRFRLAADPGGEAGARADLLLFPPTGQPPLRESWPRLALLIDDFGHNFSRVARGMLDLDIPVTASILPGLRFSERVEKEARRRGHAVFLHLPMEPLDYPAHDPGDLAIFTGMRPDSVTELLSEMSRNFERLDGFNNHMGSRASREESLVGPILDWAADSGLLVVDSMTDPKSRIYPLARSRDLPALRADLFLDGEGEPEAEIMENLAAAAEMARKRGWAMAICHPGPRPSGP